MILAFLMMTWIGNSVDKNSVVCNGSIVFFVVQRQPVSRKAVCYCRSDQRSLNVKASLDFLYVREGRFLELLERLCSSYIHHDFLVMDVVEFSQLKKSANG